ncbi:MAG: metallophosphoesterase [Candidatus Solibacter usitatus]|nr:metallophosphoesterase [Candidatus Solibacter usitatus]
MEYLRRWGPMLVVIVLTLAMQVYVARRLSNHAAMRRSRVLQTGLLAALVLASVWMAVLVPYCMQHESQLFPPALVTWLMALSLAWVIAMISATLLARLSPPPQFDPSRRRLLAMTAPVVAAAPLLSAGFGAVVARAGARLEEIDVWIPGLPADLRGIRLVQLTDIHYGPFFGRAELERAVAMANETRAHLAFITGDLITRRGDNLDGCLQVLRNLRAEAGVFGCHGNHEDYAGAKRYVTAQAALMGFRFLRQQASPLKFGSSTLNLVGYDYQRMGGPQLEDAESMVRPGAVNLLLSHSPAVFPRAAAAGFQLTLAGHTHGGQVNVEILSDHLNVARLFTPYVKGAYSLGNSRLYVSSGLGTVGVPVRLGAPPEVSLIRLCGA